MPYRQRFGCLSLHGMLANSTNATILAIPLTSVILYLSEFSHSLSLIIDGLKHKAHARR
jgi:hypothetical protein